MTKKLFYFVIAAALICGASVFTSCTASDNPAQPAEPDLNVAEKIIGKWITAESDGKAIPTNDKVFYDFVSTTKAYVSLSFQERKGAPWIDREEPLVDIVGNHVTLTHSIESGRTLIIELHVEVLTNSAMVAKRTTTIRQDGGLVSSEEDIIRFEKLDVDYSADIIGMWEGHSTGEEGSEFDDGENHRWEYMTDGSFNYFHKVDGRWHISNDAYAEYFVAGNLLCTRWKNEGVDQEEHREWWEIESIKDGVMKWKALRQKEDGTTYTATFEMKKIDVPTQAEVEQNIIGRWMTTTMDFQNIPTNNKIVFEFESLTKAYLNASLNSVPELPALWNKKTELTVAIVDNHIVLTGQKDEHTASKFELIITEMSADRMECITIHSEINEKGEMVTSPAFFTTYEKVDKDYSAEIIGMWEGRMTSEQSVYGDVEDHRWEYMTDGTFNFFRKVDDQWQISDDDFSDYFVAGNLLCTRWKNAGAGNEEHREWWEIESIENGVMKWKALRQNADGTTYTATFEMKKVTE